MRIRFLGILREPVYSPGKVEADRAILQAVARVLSTGHQVRVINAENGLPDKPDADIVFTMAQGPSVLAVLRRWQDQGVRVINTADAIEGCHRHRSITALARMAVPQPPTVCVKTADGNVLPEWINKGAWVKRGDVHATQADDVAYVASTADACDALARLARRGIVDATIQRHVAGTVIKFYAVRDTFFACFPPREARADLSIDAVAAVRALAENGAAALGLEIFGGDCVRDADAQPVLIDMNDWPSYGPCRSEAAHAIARYVATAAR